MFRFLSLMAVTVGCLGSPLDEILSDRRIVGGTDTLVQKYPYQLSMQYHEEHQCGASIISRSWALTAAHCCVFPVNYTTVRAGSTLHDLGGRVHRVVMITQHLQYNAASRDFDVGLVRVSTPFIYGCAVAPARLPFQGMVTPTGASTAVTGWGYTSYNGELSRILQVVRIPTTSVASCREAFNRFRVTITDRMLCAGFPAGGKDACQGDSGGPMVYNGRLIGVTSFGYACANPNMPGVYAKVSEVRKWISTTAGV